MSDSGRRLIYDTDAQHKLVALARQRGSDLIPLDMITYILFNDTTAVEANEVVHGYWINTPPYTASNGEYNKAQECSVCNAYFVSSGYTKYFNHPYCCECGAKMDLPSTWRNT